MHIDVNIPKHTDIQLVMHLLTRVGFNIGEFVSCCGLGDGIFERLKVCEFRREMGPTKCMRYDTNVCASIRILHTYSRAYCWKAMQKYTRLGHTMFVMIWLSVSYVSMSYNYYYVK